MNKKLTTLIFGLVALLPAASVVAEGGKIERYREIRERHAVLIGAAKAEVKRLQNLDISEFSEVMAESEVRSTVYEVINEKGEKVKDVYLHDDIFYSHDVGTGEHHVRSEIGWKQGAVVFEAVGAHPEIKGREAVKKYFVAEAEKVVKAREADEISDLNELSIKSRLLGGSVYYAKKGVTKVKNNPEISIPATLMVGIMGHLAYRNLISKDLTIDELLSVTKACLGLSGKKALIEEFKKHKVLVIEIYTFLGSTAVIGVVGAYRAINK